MLFRSHTHTHLLEAVYGGDEGVVEAPDGVGDSDSLDVDQAGEALVLERGREGGREREREREN